MGRVDMYARVHTITLSVFVSFLFICEHIPIHGQSLDSSTSTSTCTWIIWGTVMTSVTTLSIIHRFHEIFSVIRCAVGPRPRITLQTANKYSSVFFLCVWRFHKSSISFVQLCRFFWKNNRLWENMYEIRRTTPFPQLISISKVMCEHFNLL